MLRVRMNSQPIAVPIGVLNFYAANEIIKAEAVRVTKARGKLFVKAREVPASDVPKPGRQLLRRCTDLAVSSRVVGSVEG